MAAVFTEAQRVQVRNYLGYSGLWLQADPRLESAITNIQSVPNGTRPDDSTYLLVVQLITKLQNIDNQLDFLSSMVGTTDVSKSGVKIDVARETARLTGEGRKYVHRLARVLDTEPRADIYGPAPESATAYPSAPFGGRSGY